MCHIFHKHRVPSEISRAIQTWNRGSWVWQSIPCLPQRDKLVQSICFLTVVHSFTHVQSSIQDTKVPLPDPGIHTASGARLQHDGGRLVTFKLPEGRTTRVLFHACEVQQPILSLGCHAQQGYWSDLRADTGTLFFPDKTQTKHSETQLHKEESLFFVEGMLVAPLLTAGVSDEVAQEIQIPIGPQMLDDVEEPMPVRPTTLKDLGNPDQIVMEQHSLTHFPSQRWCKMCLESRGRDSPHREQSKIDAVVPHLQFDNEQTPLLEPSTRRWCQTPRRWTCPILLRRQPNGCVTRGMNACVYKERERRRSSVAAGQSGKRMSS